MSFDSARRATLVVKTLAPLVLGTTVFLSAAPAEAKLFDLYLQAQLGAGGGGGTGGAQEDNAFASGASGGAYGLLAGAEILFFDVWVNHTQYFGSSGINGTLTQFMLGFDVDFALDEPDPGKENVYFAEVGLAGGFGLGTGQQVDPPLDNAQVTDKGGLLEAHVSGEYRINRALSAGVSVPIQWAYMVKNGPGVVANDTENHYQQLSVAVFAFFQFHVEL